MPAFWIVLSMLYLLAAPVSLSAILVGLHKKGNQKGAGLFVGVMMALMAGQAVCYGFFPQLFSLIYPLSIDDKALAFFLVLTGIELVFLLPVFVVFFVGFARLQKGRPVPTVIY